MGAQEWDDDAALLADLGRALAEDAEPPPSVTTSGRAAFGWRTVDEDLRELTRSAAVGEPVRAGTTPTAVAFVGGGSGLELERDGDVVRGQLLPPGPGTVQVVGGATPLPAIETSDDGFFVVRRWPPTAVRVRVSTGAGEVVTPWFEL